MPEDGIITTRAKIIAELEEIEAAWQDPPEARTDDHFPCIPYPLGLFADLCDTAVRAALRGSPPDEVWFLDVGCGIGTKAAYAHRMHGVHARGIDRFHQYVTEAERNGILAAVWDASEFTHYSVYDIVYVNHPYRDPLAQHLLDQKIQDAMQPGSLLITVNQRLDTLPSYRGWEIIHPKPPHWPISGVWRKV